MALAPTLHGIVGGATIAAPEPEAEPESLGIAWESRFLKRAAWNRNSNAGSRIGSERCVDRKRTVYYRCFHNEESEEFHEHSLGFKYVLAQLKYPFDIHYTKPFKKKKSFT